MAHLGMAREGNLMRGTGRLVLAAGLLATVVGGIGAAPARGVSKESRLQKCTPPRAAEGGTTSRTLQQDGLEVLPLTPGSRSQRLQD